MLKKSDLIVVVKNISRLALVPKTLRYAFKVLT